ncbi:protein SCO1/2 [Marinobacter daqiaonensis]|uniref:Protein SCO1/2 n=1 Tax=Marinobacter daqiaonensis TaxID=650891 RepID=A0A1I6IGV3_9GAMM|nr:SCO family protein [Marinobacter daqiaonensis]SFR65879.1 protein SCO1/2 [Marinobacter daqiaonensis]
MNRSVRRTLVLLLLVVALIFGLVVSQQMRTASEEPPPAPDLSALNTYVYNEPRTLTPFSLTGDTGETVTLEDLKGGWTFVFVGYTHCPDICPATMSTLRRFSRELPPELPEPEFLLVSADPQRDTPERLQEYLDFFGEDFHGLTGDIDELRELARSVNAVFVHRDDGDGNNLVDHSGHLTLLDPEGRMVAVIQPPHEPDKLIRAYRQIYQWARENHPRAG